MNNYSILIETAENTVVAKYTPEPRNSESYQSEAELEKDFIHRLTEQGYEYLTIHKETDLIENLRKQLEILNRYTFTDDEWKRFFSEHIANANDSIIEKTRTIQEDNIKVLKRDNGMSKNITLIDRKHIHNNSLQVINQYAVDTGEKKNRYDVTILVNGLPLVHIELKRRGVAIREAFNQIDRYQRESFWSGSGLFQYVQIFVISNGTNTKYYSNTTRKNYLDNKAKQKTATSNSFEFTSFWADANNKVIPDLVDFTNTFFARHTLLNILTRYCVFDSNQMLLVMRPYQIVATERILNKIEIANNYKKYGSKEGGGYIWHTTGSGKTLTSFKTARLACELDYIDKVLFVVDRKDLDYQTMREYDRFEKGAANGNTSVKILQKQLEDSDSKIIITTIQKLAAFIKKYPAHEVYQKRIVMIFDECHRSQFGDMHKAITRKFKKYHLFGFTGTPIFTENAVLNKAKMPSTTEQIFGDRLHEYTIIDAIRDKNVLPFRIDYLKTLKAKGNIEDKKVIDINRESAYEDDKRIAGITQYILEHFNQKTYRNDGDYGYFFTILENIPEIVKSKRHSAAEEYRTSAKLKGFNSIFAVASVEMARMYYDEFQKQMKERPELSLKIAMIYSYTEDTKQNKESQTVGEQNDGILEEENSADTSNLSKPDKEALERAISDYNQMFHTDYDTSMEKFPNYYKDVSLRMKNKEIDLLIVVNMFLTGFDATTLNTLWVDKNLKMHGLIQAFSRTNRILSKVKRFGNIVCFRNLREQTDEAIALFADKEARNIITLRKFDDYYNGYDNPEGKHIKGYVNMIAELTTKFPLSEPQIIGEKNQKDFIHLLGAVLRMRNLLVSFDDFEGKEIISQRDFQDYLGRYQDLHDEWSRKRVKGQAENIDNDVVFELELVQQIEVNIDYILNLIEKYHATNCKDDEILIMIQKAVSASPELRSKKDLIEKFIANINKFDDTLDGWISYITEEREEMLQTIISEENLKSDETQKLIDNAFHDGVIKTTGTNIDKILPAISRFGSENRKVKKERVIEKLKSFFEKFRNIG